MDKKKLALGGAFGAALLVASSLIAASCCIAPSILLLLGISAGGLSQLSALEPYRPAFIAFGTPCLAYAAWQFFRQPTPSRRT
jgi:mercuric ion transport protein